MGKVLSKHARQKDATSAEQPIAPHTQEVDQLALMKSYMSGRFSNQHQIDEQLKGGNQTVGHAVRINKPIDDQIMNKPPAAKNMLHIFEATYKTHVGETERQSKPLVVRFERMEDGNLKLSSLVLPSHMALDELQCDKKRVEWQDFSPSPTFPATPIYTFLPEDKTFVLNVSVDISPGVTFSVKGKFEKDTLTVTEGLCKDGKLAKGYFDEPIIYKRTTLSSDAT